MGWEWVVGPGGVVLQEEDEFGVEAALSGLGRSLTELEGSFPLAVSCLFIVSAVGEFQ